MMCLVGWFRSKVLPNLQPKGTTPVNWWILTALFFSMFGNAIVMQMLFAFLPDMVKSFGISDEDAGYYVGLLASAMYFGRFISSYFWGWLCDKIGRRKVLLWCLALLGLTTLGFGFAKSFVIAFIIRFLTGLAAGVAGTVKAALAEVCDDTNQAFGMSVVVTAWNTGLIIGPAIGGYLARPADKYPIFKNASLFETFAYLLPCLVNALILLLSFLLAFFKLPETLQTLKKKKENECLSLNGSEGTSQMSSENVSANRNHLSNNSQELNDPGSAPDSKPYSYLAVDMPELACDSGSVSFLPDIHLRGLPHTSTSLDDVSQAESAAYVLPKGKPKERKYSRAVESLTRSKLFTLCRNRDVRYSVGLYTVYSFAVLAEHEIYSVWAASGKDLGGLSFDTNDLGFTLMVVGVGTASSSCLVFPLMVKVFGHIKTHYLMLSTVMFFTIILPCTNILYGRGTSLKIAVIAVLLAIRIAQGCCFTAQFIFIGNSVTSNYRATVHGLAMTATCGARSFAPTIAGSLFSWSVASGLGFPFNEKFVYIFTGFVFWLALVLACFLDVETVSKRSD